MTDAAETQADGAWKYQKLGRYELATSTEFGPRVTGLWAGDGTNLLAVLGPEVSIENPTIDNFLFRGGHRLWVAPEIPEITYAPDDNRCAVTQADGYLRVSADPDRAGFAKTLEIKPDGRSLTVDHELVSNRHEPTNASPWAITQFPPGGTAILPLGPREEERSPLQADRSLILWSYTRLNDPRVVWLDRGVVINALPGPQMKLGAGPEPRKLGYLKDGLLFSKWFEAAPAAAHADRGATAQIFLNEDFCELETQGPVQILEPGASVTHREFWEVRPCSGVDAALDILLGEKHA